MQNDDAGRTGLKERFDAAAIGSHPIWDTITKLAAPAAVAVSAALYLTGYVYRSTVLRRFGFDADLIDHPLQETIADGYIPLLLVSILVSVIVLFFVILHKLVNDSLARITENGRAPTFAQKITLLTGWILRVILVGNTLNATMLLLLSAVAAGLFFGGFKANQIEEDVRHCSARCFTYVLRQGQVHGRAIASSKENLLIVTNRAAYRVKSDDLKWSLPARGRRWDRFSIFTD